MSDFSALSFPPKNWDPQVALQPSSSQILEQPWRFVQPTGVGRFVQDAAMIAGAPGRTIVDLLGHTAIGAARLFGADIEPMNVTTQAQAYLRRISGQAAGMTQDEVYRAEMAREQSAHNQMGLVSKSLHNAGEMFGWVAGTFGMPGGTSRLFLGSGAAVNQKLTSFNKWLLDTVRLRQAPKWLPRAAALGQLETIRAMGSGQGGGLVFDQDVPEGWRALETGVMAGAMYPVFEFMGRLGRAAAARTLLKGSGKDYEAFRKWAEKNTTMLGTEAPEQYMARSIEAWVSAGSPGASNRTLTKLLATAEQSAIEGLGYSALDVEWWKLAAEAILEQDWKKGEDWLAKTLGNMLGVAAIHAGGKLTEVMPWQRRQPSVEQVIQEAKGKELPTEKMPLRGLKPGEPVPEEKPQAEPTGEQAAPVLDPNLSRLGWVAGEGKVTLGQKSPYSFEVAEGKAVPSVRLKEVLGIKEPVELQAFQRILEFASLNNALAAKANLGGRPVSVEGVHGVEGITEGKEGKLYTFRFNEVLERPLSPEGEWKRVKEYPARAPDEVSAEQGQAADAVAEWRMRRQDLTPEVEALADRVIKVLRTVAAEKDPGVRETLQVFPEVMERMQQNPEQGIRDLAHLLTSKSPEIWSQELQKQQEQQEQDQQTERPVSVGATQAGHAADVLRVHEQGVPERRSLQKKMAEAARGGKRTEVPVTEREAQQMSEVLRAVEGQQEPQGEPMQLESRKQSLRDLVAKMQKPKAHQQPLEVFTSGMEGVEKARGAKAHKEAVLKAIKAGEVVNPEVLKDYPELGQAQAFGGLIPPQVARVLETMFWKVVEGTKQILGPFIRTEWTPIVERVRSLGEGPLADRAWKVITDFKDQLSSVQNTWADFAESINPKGGGLHTAKELGERLTHPSFPDKYYWTKWHAHSDEKAGRFLNVEVSDLSPEAQKAVLDGHELFFQVGLALQEAGAVVRNIPGEQGEATRFTADPNRWRMVRRMTPMMMEAARQKTGPLYEAYVEMISDLLKIDISEAQKKASAMLDRALVSHDAAEFAREFELMPDAIRLKDGTLVEILEAHPYEQVRAMMMHGLLRAAYGKEFGWEVAADGMPSPEIVQGVNTQAKVAVQDLIRALNGVPVSDPIPFLQPGTPLYDMHNFWRSWLHLWRMTKMSLSAVANLGEVTGAAPTFLGAGRVAKSTGEAVQILADGRMRDVIRELVDEGFFTRDILNYDIYGAGSEKVRRTAQVIGQVGTLPFRGVQEYFVEFPIALAIRDAHRAMLTGEAAGSLPLRSMLEGMGIERATAEAMLKGQAEPADYDRFKRNALHYLAGGTTGTTAEKVLNSQRNVLKNAIMFADFFRARSNQLRGLTAQMGKAVKAGDKQGIKDATLMMLRFMGFSGLSGGITSSLMAALDDGLDGVAQMWHEMALDPVYGMRMVVLSSFLGGIGGSIINELLQGDSDEGLVERLYKAVPMYDAVTEPGEFLVSFTPLASSENQYAGMDLLEKTGAFARQITPAYRRAHEGLFGIAAIALSKEDPKVDAAQDSWWRWWRDNVGFEGGSGDKDAEQKEFRVSMREVSRLLKEGQRDGPAIMQALVTAAKAKGWDSVASSLRRRKFFDSDFNGLERDQQKALLEWIGPDKARLLRRYDAVVDVLIEWVNDRR